MLQLSFIRKVRLLLIIMLIAASGLQAQTKKIFRVHDTNLFELADGQMIRMAGIEMPPKDIPGEYIGELAKHILNVVKSELENKEIDVTLAGGSSSDTSVTLVYLTRKYALQSTDYSRKYLKLGYGRFQDNTDSLHGALYRQAEAEAIERKNGMWDFRLPEVKDTLDRKYSLSEVSYLMRRDSLYRIEFLRKRAAPLGWQITMQAATGALGSGLGIFFGGLIGVGIASKKSASGDEAFGRGVAGMMIGSLTGYVLSAPLGVYVAAKPNNPSLSYWPTLLYSSLFTAAAAGIAAINDDIHPLGYIAGVMPLVGSMIYVNFMAPNPVRDTVVATEDADPPHTRNMSYNELYNRQMQFRVNILTLSF